MEYGRQGRGLRTFFEHGWLFVVAAATLLLASLGFSLLKAVEGAPRVWWGGVMVAVAGAALILHAKLPLYRERRFFTFGSRALPEDRRRWYRWGYYCLALAGAWFVWSAWVMP